MIKQKKPKEIVVEMQINQLMEEEEDDVMTVPTVQIVEKKTEHRNTRKQKIVATILIVIRTHAIFGILKLHKKLMNSSRESLKRKMEKKCKEIVVEMQINQFVEEEEDIVMTRLVNSISDLVEEEEDVMTVPIVQIVAKVKDIKVHAIITDSIKVIGQKNVMTVLAVQIV